MATARFMLRSHEVTHGISMTFFWEMVAVFVDSSLQVHEFSDKQSMAHVSLGQMLMCCHICSEWIRLETAAS